MVEGFALILIFVVIAGWDKMIETVGPTSTVVICCVGLVCITVMYVVKRFTRHVFCEKCRVILEEDEDDDNFE